MAGQIGELVAKKYLDSQTKGKMGSQNIVGLLKQILMALQFFFLFHALVLNKITKKYYTGVDLANYE